MSDDHNPFKQPVARSNQNAPDVKRAWIAAGIMGVLMIVALLLWATAEGKLRGLENISNDLDKANTNLANAQADAQKDKEQILDLQNQVADLQKEKDKVGQMSKGLEDEMRSDLESKNVTISNLKGKLTVNILDRLMFDSGEAFVKPDGEPVLRKIASLLAAHPELKIQVIGHTDNLPIRNRFPSNWELSVARALAAVHFLTEKAGVDPRRVGAAGYGEYRPIADNSTAEGRAKNRRIAIAILPDELAVADAVNPTNSNPTNAAPGSVIPAQPR